MSYEVPKDQAAYEKLRHSYLSQINDPGTKHLFEICGIQEGHKVLEVGCGAGSVARLLSPLVGDAGHVTATDIDEALLEACKKDTPANTTFQLHDISKDALPDNHFDIVHARAVLQHIEQREEVLAKLVAATKPGGWVILEDSNFNSLLGQPIPEPFSSLVRLMLSHGQNTSGHDAVWALRMADEMRKLCLEDIHCEGRLWTMKGGHYSLEWLVTALAWAAPKIVEAGAMKQAVVDEAIAQARDPEFRLLSSTHIDAWGRKPG